MAAAGGLNLPVGIELSQVEKDLARLTSKVEKTESQLMKHLDIAPHVNTKAFEASLQKMTKVWDQITSKFSKNFEFKFNTIDSQGIQQLQSLKFDDMFGSVDKMESSMKRLKAMLRNPESFNIKNTGELQSIIQLQELYIKNWQTATGEIHKQDAAVKTLIAKEAQLREQQEKRIATLRNQMNAIQGDKSGDLQKRLVLAKKISDEMRKWGTNAGNLRAAENDKIVRALQQQVEQKRKAEKEDERLINLADRQDQLLRKFNEANNMTISGLSERYNLSKRILYIQRQLASTAFADSELVKRMKGATSPTDARFIRTYLQQKGLADDAQTKGNLQEELRLRQKLQSTLLNRQVHSGEQLPETAQTAQRIAYLKKQIQAQREANSMKKVEAQIQARINSLENDRANAKGLSKKISQTRAELSAVRSLIVQYERLAAEQRKRGYSVDATENKINALKREKMALINLEAEERARQKAVNQNNALLNDQEKLWGKLWTAASRYLNIFMLWNFGKKIIETTGYFQQQQVALEGILGSAAKAEKAIQRIKNMALNSPKTTYELVGYTKQLAAYNVGDSDPDKLLNTVHELAELSTGLGVDMQRLILAYGQVNAASVLRGQELRQFTEAGIPLVEKLAEKFTELNGKLVTTGEVFGLISKRQVSFEMVASVLSDMTKEGGQFYEMQSRITDTLYGQMQKLKDLWTVNLDRLGKSTGGLLSSVVSAMQALVKNIRPIANALLSFGILKTAVKYFNLLVLASGTFHVRLLRGLVAMRAIHRQIIATHGAMAKMRLLATAFTSTGWGALLNIAIGSIATIIGLIVKARQKTKEWNQTLNDINSSFAKDTVALTSGLDKLIGKLRTLNSSSKEYKDTLETLKSNYGEYISDSILTQLEQEMNQVDKTALSWGRLSDAIKQAVFERKEYERHESRRTTSIDNILKDLEGDFNKVIKNVIKEHTTRESYLENSPGGVKTRRYYNVVDAIGSELKRKNANGAILAAIREALEMGIGEDGLQQLLEEQLMRYGFSPAAASALGVQSKTIYNKVKKAQGYKEYTEESEYLETALQTMVDRRFREAAENISNNFSRYTGKKDGSGSYNPFGVHEYSNNQYIAALREIMTSDKYRRYVPKEFTEGLMKNQQFLAAIRMQDIDEGKTKAIAEAITAFANELNDPSIAKNINTIVDAFVHAAGVNGIDAARVRTHMAQYLHFGGMNLTDAEKDYINRWKPTDQTIESNIAALSAEYQSMHDRNEQMLSHDADATFNEEYRRNERLMAILDILARKEYYNVGSWIKQKGGRTEREFPEWVNIFKDAYELYKNVVTEGGTEAGVAKVRADKTIQELYGDFFGKAGAIKEFSFNIGNRTIADIIQDNLIKGGLEDGIVDFRAAATAAAKEMIRYGNASKETRGHFIRSGEQLLKWVSDTFADDSAAKWLEELSKATEDLTVSFEYMRRNIELGRKMSEMGTLGSFESITGVGRPDILSPGSFAQRQYISRILKQYNDWASGAVDENGNPIAKPFSLSKDINRMNLADIAYELQKLTDVYDMNMQAFRATKEGDTMMKKLTAALRELDNTIRTEIGGINGMQYSGNRLDDAITNSLIGRNSAIEKLVEKMKAEIAHRGTVGTGDYKQFADSIKKGVDDIFKNFEKQLGHPLKRTANGTVYGIRPYDIEAVRKQYNATKGRLNLSASMQGEMDQMWYQIEKQMKDFNASIGTGLFKYMQDFLHPEVEAARRYKELDDEATRIGERQIELEQIPVAERSEGEMKELADIGNRLIQILQEKTDMGMNGENIIPDIRNNAYNNMVANPEYWKKNLDMIKSSADALFSSIKSMTDTISKFYDIMNDGDNPEWIKDMDGYIEDLIGDFESLVAPIVAVMGLVTALTIAIAVLGTTAGAVFGAFIAAAAVVAAIMAVIQMHDRRLERRIDDLKKEVEELDSSIQHLQSIAERSVGFDKLRSNIAAIGKELSKATEYAEMARLEMEKKNTDEDKVNEYERSQQQAIDEFLNGIRGIRDELVSATDDWASQMGGAIRSAFQNGENAARAFRDTVKTMIGDVIEKMLQMAILEPLIESALENWTNSDYLRQKYTKEWSETDENGKTIKRTSFDQDNYLKELLENIGNADKAEDFYQNMLMIGDTLIDTVNGLDPLLKDFYMHNSELGTLSGGIESVTEDTARRNEALDNSQLGELFAIRTLLEQYLGNNGGFGDSTMAYLQAAMVRIANDTSLIRIATESILKEIQDLRISPSRPIHFKMV